MKVKSLSRVQLVATPWTVAYQAPLSMGFSRQEYWSGVPLPSLGCWPRDPKTNVRLLVGEGSFLHSWVWSLECSEDYVGLLRGQFWGPLDPG